MNSKKEEKYAAAGVAQGNSGKHLLLTIDVEDWFQVENFRQVIHPSTWSSYEPRVERNTHRLLEILSEAKIQT